MHFKIQLLLVCISAFLLHACATYQPQYSSDWKPLSLDYPNSKKISHSFYLIGDAGNSPQDSVTKTFKNFQKALNNASANSTAIFLGDNIYPAGLPKKKQKDRKIAQYRLQAQINTTQNFKGNTIFIPGNHDWYNKGLKGLKRQEEYIEKALGKNTFLPENGCPIEKVTVNDKLIVLIVDSHWYVTNWDRHPTINDDCTIRTRDQFLAEFKKQLKKAQGKTVIVAIHHPMYTVGSHGGNFSLASHYKPLPVLGSFVNLLRKTSGASNADDNHPRYRELKKRLKNLARQSEEIIFVSGHEHSLQYTIDSNIVQIVSGSGSKKSATRRNGNTQFSYGTNGYARLDIFEDGSSFVRFYEGDTNNLIYNTSVFQNKMAPIVKTYSTSFPKTKKASIYTKEEVSKSKLYQKIWGKRYREDYGVDIEVPTVQLDTLLGGLTPVRMGGGNQSKSLRLKNKEGKEYVMRALRKNALQFLQAVAFKDQYLDATYQNTATTSILQDGYTGSHPYAPFVIGALADAIAVYHSNPKLYYVPKQISLGTFNSHFGDELYMIEERVASNHSEVTSFGGTNTIISTSDMIAKLRKNHKHRVDELGYIRARIFDMLIGDWDRHEDQWRWGVYKKENYTIYKPIPRDRDQAFSIIDDGWLLKLVTALEPNARTIRGYSGNLKHPKWSNTSRHALDVALISRSTKKVWDQQVAYIQENITDGIIDEAFTNFPKEINQKTIIEIRKKLISRRKHLKEITDKYYAHFSKYAIVKGTDKEDYITINRSLKGTTEVKVFESKGKETPYFEKTYSTDTTREIWIYGLDGKDKFEVIGSGKGNIPIRIIGGQNKDTYRLQDKKRVFVFDYASKKSDFTGILHKYHLTDRYKTNVYDYDKLKNSTNKLVPKVAINPDDGLLLGFADTYTKYGFVRNPYTYQHRFSGGYFFATEGFDLAYKGSFANTLKKWNLDIDIRYTSPNYSRNFFGFGNNTIDPNSENRDQFNLNFNRVRIQQFISKIGLVKNGALGSQFSLDIAYQNFRIEKTTGRFINEFLQGNPSAATNDFLNPSIKYSYQNVDNKAFPTLGMSFEGDFGYAHNIKQGHGFPYFNTKLSFNHKLTSTGKLILATILGSQSNFNTNFEFYQAATLGDDNGLRGYRRERFSGKHALYQSTDIRYQFGRLRTAIIPINLGLFAGFDYGKVWVDSLNENKWNTDAGGGVFVNISDLAVANLSAFKGRDNLRIAFRLGFDF